jgi:hypothetical protein
MSARRYLPDPPGESTTPGPGSDPVDQTGVVTDIGCIRMVRRYPSNTTDAEWALARADRQTGRRGGRPPVHSRRDIVDAIHDVALVQFDAIITSRVKSRVDPGGTVEKYIGQCLSHHPPAVVEDLRHAPPGAQDYDIE